MGLFSTPIKTLNDPSVHMLQDVYYAEQQIVKNLPTRIEKISSPELHDALQSHLTETNGQVVRLERGFAVHNQPVRCVNCPAIVLGSLTS